MWQTVFQKRVLIILGVAFLIITWAIFLTSHRETNRENLPEWLTRGVVRPLQALTNSTSNLVGDTWWTLNRLGSLNRENMELRETMVHMDMENRRLKLLAQENRRLRKALKFTNHPKLELLPAEVIAQAPHHWNRTLTIDKGRQDGLRKNMAVITPAGLAGRILSVRNHSAEVLLINDGRDGNSLSGVLERTRDLVYIYGAGGFCRVVPSDIGVVLRPGDRIYTAESSLYFPRDLRVGVIVDVKQSGAGLKGEAILKPSVASSRLEEVFVVLRPISRTPERRQP